MMARFILLIVSITLVISVEGQVKRKIKRGRRNKSEAQLVLDPQEFQVEWEVGHELISDSLSTFVHPNLVLRYGIRQGTDVSIETNILTTKLSRYSGKLSTTGFEPILLGVDHVILKETDHRPSLVGSIQLALPFLASQAYQATHLGANVQLSAGRTIRKNDVVNISGELFWDGFSTIPIYSYSLSYLLQLKSWAASATYFGFIGTGLPQHNLDISWYWQPNDKLQFGATGGIGLNHAAHKNYISLSGQVGFGGRAGKN